MENPIVVPEPKKGKGKRQTVNVTKPLHDQSYVDVICPVCKKTVTLNYNGGELDGSAHTACNLHFYLHTPIINVRVERTR